MSLFSESLLVHGVSMFMQGKFRVTGNMRLSMKLGLMFHEPSQTSALAAGLRRIWRADIDGSPYSDAEIQ